ncbi:MAG: hypothetical protein AB1589_23855 [Cyanobacteriota bacterium]
MHLRTKAKSAIALSVERTLEQVGKPMGKLMELETDSPFFFLYL